VFPVKYELNSYVLFVRNSVLKSSSTTARVVRQRNLVMSPAGPEINNDCAGEDQQ
jgi:hypothetical protein